MRTGRGYRIVSALASCLALIGLTCGAAQERLEPIKWSIKLEKVESSGEARKRGDKFKIELTAKIDEGWHLYAPEQPPGGPIPTRIEMPADQPFKLAAEIETPPPRIELDPNFNLETQFYEDEAVFTLPVGIAADAPVGKQEVKVNVLFQTCNGQKCLPPKRLKLAVPIEIAQE